ncbi:alpha/beta fold hydrolase [Streptomyces sp. R21]|uniref:Alpha/beta fold hydrolase n=1 Tax=Streptomyces sp. R21 TaxID=3238627 RepID=A0AB39PE69_9ACTN
MRDHVGTVDGRRLRVEVSGHPDGHPVFLLHGTPGSRVGPRPRPMFLYQRGTRLISYDRPGYGGSDRRAGRRVVDVVQDVAVVADALGVDRFAVVGRSGGAPHALACAALLPDRVTRAAALVGLAPRDAEGLDWFAGMAPSNVDEFRTAFTDPERFEERLIPRSDAIRSDPARLLEELRRDLTADDRSIVSDTAMRSMLLRNFREALRTSPYGWIDDALALTGPWGFDPADIRVPVLLWHGEQDVFSPASHASWLAARIPQAKKVVEPTAAHFAALRALPKVIGWLIEGALV